MKYVLINIFLALDRAWLAVSSELQKQFDLFIDIVCHCCFYIISIFSSSCLNIIG